MTRRMDLSRPVDFRLTCEEYGITVNDLAASTGTRYDVATKWMKRDRPYHEAQSWVAGRVEAVDRLAQIILDSAMAEHGEAGVHSEPPALITFRTEQPLNMFHGQDPELTSRQHRAATRKAIAYLRERAVPFTVDYWEDVINNFETSAA